MMRGIFAGVLLALSLAPAASAQTVQVPPFKAIELRGGGEVIVRYGPAQRVTITEGNSSISSLEVAPSREWRSGRNTLRASGESLVIRACRDRCPRGYKLRVEIVSPDLSALAVTGGGTLRTEGNFPRTNAVGLAVTGGGMLDARALSANAVGASVTGGGLINTAARQSLGASVTGGGTIRYWGTPSVGQHVVGGGAVVRAGD